MRNARTTRQSGQSLIVAVIALFVLLFIGAIFVGLVARNLLNAGRARDTLSALELAQAGIAYCSHYLENSPEGADWRPPIVWAEQVDPRDPDRRWLVAGYSRIPFAGGRALVRVSYQPRDTDSTPGRRVLDPNGKYLRIESVGRVGTVDPTDPTTFSVREPRLRRELVAFKSVSITDYLRYVTNKDKDSKTVAYLGVPPLGLPLAMQLGKLAVRGFGTSLPGEQLPGAPIWVNGDLELMGDLILSTDPRNGEGGIRVAGNIRLADPNNPPRYVDPVTGGSGPIRASDDPQFETYAGSVRDASSLPDAKGYTRSISRLDPPRIDVADRASGVTRYRMLTRDSGRILGTGTGAINTGRFGLGEGIYIDNFRDDEQTSGRVAGGQTARSIWLKPGSTPSWNGPFYIPPAAFIEFGYFVVQRRSDDGELQDEFVHRPGFRIVRGDRPFRDPAGAIAPTEMVWTFFIYKARGQRPVIKAENEFFRSYLKNSQGMSEQEVDRFLPPFNGVLFAEGNVRVRGLLPSKTSADMPIRRAPDDGDTDSAGNPLTLTDGQVRDAVAPPAVTLVSDKNIYIEGSLVRESADSSIALLAKENVAVNTTAFLAPNKRMPFVGSRADEQPPYHAAITTAEASSTPPFALDFILGDNPEQYTPAPGNSAVPFHLLLRHNTSAGNTWINVFVNPALPPTNPAGDSLFRFNANTPPFTDLNLPPHVYPVLNRAEDEQREFQILPRLFSASTYAFNTRPGTVNQIRPAIDPDFTATEGVRDYLFARAALSPMDIRIEAVLYAQDGSFFVIPGYPINPNPSDTRDAALRRARELAPTSPAGTMIRPQGTSDYYPFYGEPFDCRITIVGAIAENRTASVADQAAWMKLWGYIPEVHGSTGFSPPAPNPANEQLVPLEHLYVSDVGYGGTPADIRTEPEKAARITRGLRMIYDPHLEAPFPGYDPSTPGALLRTANWAVTVNGAARQDDYGRALHPVPRLPVSPGYVFFGEVR